MHSLLLAVFCFSLRSARRCWISLVSLGWPDAFRTVNVFLLLGKIGPSGVAQSLLASPMHSVYQRFLFLGSFGPSKLNRLIDVSLPDAFPIVEFSNFIFFCSR